MASGMLVAFLALVTFIETKGYSSLTAVLKVLAKLWLKADHLEMIDQRYIANSKHFMVLYAMGLLSN